MHVRIVAVRFCNIVLKHQGKYQRSPWFVVLKAKMRNESTKERLHNFNTAFKHKWDTNGMDQWLDSELAKFSNIKDRVQPMPTTTFVLIVQWWPYNNI